MDFTRQGNWKQSDALSATVKGVVAIVEDDPDILDALGAWLEMVRVPCSLHTSGESLIHAIQRDGVQALIHAQPGSRLTWPLACVILDISLPGINGLTLANNLRAHFPGLPLLMVTALASSDRARLGTLPAGTICLQKPIDLNALEKAVFGLLH